MTRQQTPEVFMPPNILKAKVGGLFSGVDTSAVKRAEGAMESLKGQFANWAAHDVERLILARARFAKVPDAPSRAALLRVAHDMKGQAATFNYPMIVRVAGSLSKVIAELEEGEPLPLGLVDAHVSAIQVIYRDRVMDETNQVAVALTKELEARVSELLSAKA